MAPMASTIVEMDRFREDAVRSSVAAGRACDAGHLASGVRLACSRLACGYLACSRVSG